MSVISRFAPSPTGFMHFGNLRTAIFNFLYAKNQKGNFLLRIEDTDTERSTKEFTEHLLSDMKKVSVHWDMGPEFQSERKDTYDKYYAELEKSGVAYPCFCSEEKLELSRKAQKASGQPPRYSGTCRNLSKEEIDKKLAEGLKPALRFRVNPEAVIKFEDLVKGKQKFLGADIGDFIIRRNNGSASFMFANAIDDSLMKVTHALRGDDHLTNSPRQILILQALNLKAPIYGHFPMIIGKDGTKLSKRNGSCSVRDLFEEGYHYLALLNYLSRLGHSYEQNELLTEEKLIEYFNIEKISSSPAKYDISQLNYWQKEAMLFIDNKNFWNFVKQYISVKIPKDSVELFIDAIKDNTLMPQDADMWAKEWFSEVELEEESLNTLKELDKSILESICNSDAKDYQEFLDLVKETTGLKGKKLFQPLRVLLTGKLQGPELKKVFPLLGIEKINQRIKRYAANI